MILGDAKLDYIFYSFWKNEFSEAAVIFKGRLGFEEIKNICYAKWGKGNQSDLIPERYIWSGNVSLIALSYDPIENFGLLNIKSQKYLKEIDEYKKNKAREDAGKGL
jgi:hypothetical protein